MKILLFFCVYWIGNDEQVHPIQDVKGTNYVLCHKVSVFYIFLGTGVHDEGYVLQEKEDKHSDAVVINRTYQRVSAQELADYQRKGQLPTPLPTYSISLNDYFWGNSLWIALGLVAVGLVAYGVLEYQSRKNKINLSCECGRAISLDSSFGGRTVRCSQCKATISVPLFVPDRSISGTSFVESCCPSCGQKVRFPATLAAITVSCPRCNHRWDYQYRK